MHTPHLSICVSLSHLASNENENNSWRFIRFPLLCRRSLFNFFFNFIFNFCVASDEWVCFAVESYASSLNGASEAHTRQTTSVAFQLNKDRVKNRTCFAIVNAPSLLKCHLRLFWSIIDLFHFDLVLGWRSLLEQQIGSRKKTYFSGKKWGKKKQRKCEIQLSAECEMYCPENCSCTLCRELCCVNQARSVKQMASKTRPPVTVPKPKFIQLIRASNKCAGGVGGDDNDDDKDKQKINLILKRRSSDSRKSSVSVATKCIQKRIVECDDRQSAAPLMKSMSCNEIRKQFESRSGPTSSNCMGFRSCSIIINIIWSACAI